MDINPKKEFLFGRCVGIVMVIVHCYFLILSVFSSLAFFNHFSNADQFEVGLGGMLHVIIHCGCIFCGLCLYYGSKEGHKDLLFTFLVPGTIITALSFVHLLVLSIFFDVSTVQKISWTLHLLFYVIVLLSTASFWKSIPSPNSPPGQADSSMEEGMVQQDVPEGPRVSTKTALLDYVFTDIKKITGKVTGFFGVFSPTSSNSKVSKKPANSPDYAFDSDDSS